MSLLNMYWLFDDEQIFKAYAKDIEERTKERTARETEERTAMVMLKNGRISVKEIPSFFPSLTLEGAKELEIMWPQSH